MLRNHGYYLEVRARALHRGGFRRFLYVRRRSLFLELFLGQKCIEIPIMGKGVFVRA